MGNAVVRRVGSVDVGDGKNGADDSVDCTFIGDGAIGDGFGDNIIVLMFVMVLVLILMLVLLVMTALVTDIWRYFGICYRYRLSR
jgi:hypothetical protein